MVRTMAVVLADVEPAEVREPELGAGVSLEGTLPEVEGAAAAEDASLLLGTAEDGASDDAGAADEGSAAGDEGGAALDSGADEAGGAGVELGAADDGAGLLAPVPEAWRFSSWCRYSLMPSMRRPSKLRPSKLKADTRATRATRAARSHAWRSMAAMRAMEWRRVKARRVKLVVMARGVADASRGGDSRGLAVQEGAGRDSKGCKRDKRGREEETDGRRE